MPADSVMSVNGIAGMTTVDFSRPAGRESVASRGGAADHADGNDGYE